MIPIKNTTTDHYDLLVDVLGRNNINSKVETPFDFITIATKGISASVIVNFRKYFNLTRDNMAEMLNISAPTIYRWVKQDKTLERNYSIQLFELGDLFLYGTSIFQNQADFFKWLQLPNTALGGMEPIELLELPSGVSKVRNLLGRIDYGVYS